MDGIDNALEQRVRDLLDHLDEAPIVKSALPWTVEYLIRRLQDAAARGDAA